MMDERDSKSNAIRRKRADGGQLDEIDRTLLRELLRDARQKYAELGAKIHLSPPAVFERVRRLEREGVIRNFTITVDPAAVGLHVCAFVRVRTRVGCRTLTSKLEQLPAIEECHAIAGEDCILLKVRVETPVALEVLLDEIRATEGIESTNTTIVLSTHFARDPGHTAAEEHEQPSSPPSRARPRRRID